MELLYVQILSALKRIRATHTVLDLIPKTWLYHSFTITFERKLDSCDQKRQSLTLCETDTVLVKKSCVAIASEPSHNYLNCHDENENERFFYLLHHHFTLCWYLLHKCVDTVVVVFVDGEGSSDKNRVPSTASVPTRICAGLSSKAEEKTLQYWKNKSRFYLFITSW